MRVTLVQPCIGKRPGDRYPRGWLMEPLNLAVLAGLTPQGVEVDLVDDRLEEVPFDRPTDLAAMTVETYTAKRAYQIASEYRRRGVPVVMGGVHPTLLPDEAGAYADAIVAGEAETSWPELIDDCRHGRLRSRYRSRRDAGLGGVRADRTLFRGRRYLPIRLVESSRGCPFQCDFCAVGASYRGSQRWRPVDEVAAEVAEVGRRARLVFLVDDNFGSDADRAKEICRALLPLGVRWTSQCGVNAASDDELLELMARSGCQGVLIGFESLSSENLRRMNKPLNLAAGEFRRALRRLERHRIRIFASFIFGYEHDGPESFDATVEFARRSRFYLAAFNHLTPFPGTELYRRLDREGRLLFDRWWLDERYTFNRVAFRPARMTPEELRRRCLAARRTFFSTASILERCLSRANRADLAMWCNYFPLNLLHRSEAAVRDGYPLGDRGWNGKLLPKTATA